MGEPFVGMHVLINSNHNLNKRQIKTQLEATRTEKYHNHVLQEKLGN